MSKNTVLCENQHPFWQWSRRFLNGIIALPATIAQDLRAAPEQFRSSAAGMRRPAVIAGSALLTALNLVIHTFTIVVNNLLKISFTFLTVASAGLLYGPVVGGAMGAVCDVLQYIVRPTAGPYFPGFTLNAFILGFLYGLILYKRPVTLPRVFFAKLCTTVLVNLMLTPIWLSILYGDAIWTLISLRIAKNLVMLPVETAMLYAFAKILCRARLITHPKVQ